MSIVRLIVAWLIMAALPLQGFAAASMLFCDQATHSTASAERSHDHASHDRGASAAHDHASHGDDAGASGPDAKLSKQAGGGGSASAKNDGHACPICASCCNLVAVFETPTLAAGQDSPQSKPSEEVARVATRDAPTPDKPPRA